jgi:hypothetical protein
MKMVMRMTRGMAIGPGAAMAAAMLLAGCITVKAPEKPIEINLNVNIRQEVVVSLRKDVQNLDQQYPGVF